MIVYSASKSQFHKDIDSNKIESKIQSLLYERMSRKVAENELRSWRNSLQYMDRILQDNSIPIDSNIAIEYNIPLTAKRIDFIIAGQDHHKKDSVVIVELKQWDDVTKTDKDGIVKTYINGAQKEVAHPSYQAWTYSALIEDYNETIRQESISLIPCAYLHNCTSSEPIRDIFYNDHIAKAPLFIKSEADALRNFIKQHIKYGDKNDVLYKIEGGKIKPSKKLADTLSNMMAGNCEFVMVDEQKVVYESVIDLFKKSKNDNQSKVIIVEGGPGTGKTVVAINLLVELTKQEGVVQYVTKNAAPRAIYEAKLTGSMKKSNISNLFKSSGSYIESAENFFDVLLVDEAHRLNEKSGLFSNLGENQIKEIINASKVSVFFSDDDQIVTLKDIGHKEEIKAFARKAGAEIYEYKLDSQFRCNGSDAYLAWLDNMLGIRETANYELTESEFDFRVVDDPNELRRLIEEKNLINNSARIVAGYCWKWVSKKDPNLYDIVLPEYNFQMRWNLSSDGSLYLIKQDSVKEAGCIHTCQGLELDYVGVIIGDDLQFINDRVETLPTERASTDKSISGFKQLLKTNNKETEERLDKIIRNTYKTLLTRGQKGCYVYCTDKKLAFYIKSCLKKEVIIEEAKFPFKIMDSQGVIPFKNAVPLFDIKVAAGGFNIMDNQSSSTWIELPEPYTAKEGYFVCQVVGESMNKKIPNGSWCLFKEDQGGSRDGKIVLVQHRKVQDGDYGHGYTIKSYHSTKVMKQDSWGHQSITLKALSYFSYYDDIILYEDELEELKVVGVFVGVIG